MPSSKDTFPTDAEHPGLGGEPIGLMLSTDGRDFGASHGDTDMDRYLEILEHEAVELTAGGRHDVERALGIGGEKSRVVDDEVADDVERRQAADADVEDLKADDQTENDSLGG